MSDAMNTSKKVKVIGTQSYVNADTGELVEMQVTSVEERDFNFSKVWMRSFLTTLDLVGNAKTKTAYWIIDNLDRENQLTYTYRQIADAMGVSLDTVNATMKALLQADFLRRKNQGCYIVNPNVIFKGTRSGRMNVLTQFGALTKDKPAEITPQEKYDQLVSSAQALLAEAEKIKAKMDDAP